jgi:hypothetical protein
VPEEDTNPKLNRWFSSSETHLARRAFDEQ